MIDSYFPVIERASALLEEIEAEILAHPDETNLSDVFVFKKTSLELRRAIWPFRDVVNQLIREDDAFIGAETKMFLRDCHDHTLQILDLLEVFRDRASELAGLHLGMASHRMNEVMKVLTIISTIFIPTSFVASVYGMNFDTSKSPWNMPELEQPWGYVAVLGIMGMIAVGQLLYFVQRGWIGRGLRRWLRRQ